MSGKSTTASSWVSTLSTMAGNRKYNNPVQFTSMSEEEIGKINPAEVKSNIISNNPAEFALLSPRKQEILKNLLIVKRGLKGMSQSTQSRIQDRITSEILKDTSKRDPEVDRLIARDTAAITQEKNEMEGMSRRLDALRKGGKKRTRKGARRKSTRRASRNYSNGKSRKSMRRRRVRKSRK